MDIPGFLRGMAIIEKRYPLIISDLIFRKMAIPLEKSGLAIEKRQILILLTVQYP